MVAIALLPVSVRKNRKLEGFAAFCRIYCHEKSVFAKRCDTTFFFLPQCTFNDAIQISTGQPSLAKRNHFTIREKFENRFYSIFFLSVPVILFKDLFFWFSNAEDSKAIPHKASSIKKKGCAMNFKK